MAGLYKLSDLAESCKYLPLMARMEGSKQKGDLKITYLKTYPVFPWKTGTGDHTEDDPVTFINLCADAGLVKWENAAERDARIEAERKKEAEEKRNHK